MKKIFLLLFIPIFLVACDSKKDGFDATSLKEVEYKKITYREVIDNKPVDACITFQRNNDYSMYDCDSEPTNYFFDSENECTFKYDGTYMKFDCKNNFGNTDLDTIKILNWDKYTFRFMYGDEEKIFKSLSWIEENYKVDSDEVEQMDQ